MIPLLERATALRGVSLFSRLSPDEVLALARLSEEVTIDPGVAVFGEGDPPDALYVLVRGEVAVERHGMRVAALGPGECFGELGLLDESVRSATIKATRATELLRIDHDDFLDILALYPSVGRSLLEVLARRLRGTAPEAG